MAKTRLVRRSPRSGWIRPGPTLRFLEIIISIKMRLSLRALTIHLTVTGPSTIVPRVSAISSLLCRHPSSMLLKSLAQIAASSHTQTARDLQREIHGSRAITQECKNLIFSLPLYGSCLMTPSPRTCSSAASNRSLSPSARCRQSERLSRIQKYCILSKSTPQSRLSTSSSG